MSEANPIPINSSDAAAMIAALESNVTRQGRIVDIGDGRKVAILRPDEEIHEIKDYLDTYLTKPERHAGITTLHDLKSFLSQCERFRTDALTVYVSATDPEKSPTLRAVFNDSTLSQPDHEDHQAIYCPKPSPELLQWLKASKGYISQKAFAELIEDRFHDVVSPKVEDATVEALVQIARNLKLQVGTPADVLEVAAGLQINIGGTVKDRPNHRNGTTSMVFEQSQQAQVDVPGAVVLHLPFFDGGKPMLMLAKFRYQVVEKNVQWSVIMHDLPGLYRQAVKTLCDEITNAKFRVVLGEP